MSVVDKRKYIQKIAMRYHSSGKVGRGKILDEVCLTFELSRSYAIRILNQGYKRTRKKPGRASRYESVEFVKALKQLWFASEWACGKLLKPTIPLLLPHLERRHKKALSEEVKTLLLQQISTTVLPRRLISGF